LSLSEDETGSGAFAHPYQPQFNTRGEGDFESEDEGTPSRRGRTMAQFEPAYQRTLGHEGGYVDDPDDPGGETYKGVARNYHKSWPGWPIIDAYKQAHGITTRATVQQTRMLSDVLARDISVHAHVTGLYRTEYWNRLMGDSIPSQAIANELFDSAINNGVETAVEILQKALNLFIPQSAPLKIDGSIGPSTLGALQGRLTRSIDAQALLSALVVYRGIRYIGLLNNDETQREFAVSWFSRLRC
jgi:lysozyme family protein